MTTPAAPNFFAYANHELAQDAFICWLLAWGDLQYKDANPALHHCAHELIRALVGKHGLEITDITCVDVEKQWKNLDILCHVNNTFSILIEDKIYSRSHSRQLPRYLDNAKKSFPQNRLIPVYLKTRDQSRKSLEHDLRPADDAPAWKAFMRQDFLKVLATGMESGITNTVFTDFYHRLSFIEQKVRSWETTPVKDWNHLAWTGFWVWLQGRLDGDWGDVASSSGTFKGFWWHYQTIDNNDLYLQIEAWPASKERKASTSQLCFKIETHKDENKSQARTVWHDKLKEAARQQGLVEAQRPSRFGLGATMTLLRTDHAIKTKDDPEYGLIIDKEKTLAFLKQAENVLSLAIQ